MAEDKPVGFEEMLKTWVKGDPKIQKYFLEKIKDSKFLTYVPHRTQRQFHSSQARIRWFLGGNRSGKTRAGAQEVLWWATGLHTLRKDIPKPPVDIWVVSLDFPTSRDVVQPIIRQLMGQRYLKKWHEVDRIVELTNGSTIAFKSVDSGWRKFQGTAKHLIWFDEEPDWNVFTECRMRLIDKRGSMIGTMTPMEGMSWVFDEIYEPWENGTRKDIQCFICSSYDNPHVSKVELKAIDETTYDEEREARLYGRFVEFAGLIYKEFNRAVHVIKRFPIPSHWTRFRGIDPGINNPTACIWWAVNPDGEHFIYDEYSQSDKTVEENVMAIKAKTGLDDISATYIDPSACNRNPAHPELRSLRDEYSRFNIFTIPANNDVSFGINKVKELLKVRPHTGRPSIFYFNDLFKTLKEKVRYRWDTYRHHADAKSLKEKPKKVLDHLMDAERYVAASSPYYAGDYHFLDEDDSKPSTRRFTKYG